MHSMQQLTDEPSHTYTYLLADEDGREAVIIDPVEGHLDEYLNLLESRALKLRYVLETHTHADHITSAGALCQRTGAQAATPLHCNITFAEIQLDDGAVIAFGRDEKIVAIHTPGHTAGSMSYLWRDCVFTGDSLMIDGCGRCDFQGGDAGALYDSITKRLFMLPGETRVYPAHDYHGRHVSTIAAEREHNARLAAHTRDEFIDLMARLDLPPPAHMAVTLPANRRLGLGEERTAGAP